MSEDNPDHSSYSVMKAQDEEGNWLTILVDGAGRMIAVMKGYDGAELQTLAVDGEGRMIAMIRDPVSDNYVAVDGEGQMVTVIKGAYLGELKTIATDVEGRMIAVTRRSLGGSGLDGPLNVTEDENIDPDRWYNYSSLIVAEGATLGLSAQGKMFLRVAGTVTINGTISVKGKGSSGGAAVDPAELLDGNPGSADNKGGLCGGGGGGGCNHDACQAKGGAGGGSDDDGCGSPGAGGTGLSPYYRHGGPGGAYDFDYDIRHDFDEDWDYFTLNRGPGGGSGGSYAHSNPTGAGGNGGGVLYIEAYKIIVNGAITADGDAGVDSDSGNADGAGGGGAGGTVVLIAREFVFEGTIAADGGAGGSGGASSGNGGAGAAGIIKTAVVY